MIRMFAPHLTDFYKTGHIRQYPEGTQFVYSNWTCRSDKWASVLPDFDHKVVFFGLQGACQWLLVDLWNDTFFKIPRDIAVAKYKKRMDSSLGEGAVSTEHISALHDLGYLPVIIKALPEGSRVNIRVPMLTITNTLPEFYWVTNYLETQLSAVLWKPVTSATIAFEYRRLLEKYTEATGASKEFIDWQAHDFSFRGMSGLEDAITSGAGHLLSFKGTDTIPAIDYLEEYYYGDETFVGGSVPATEHSVMCMGGKESEIRTFERLITEVYPSGVVSIVSDTWDFWEVITGFTARLYDKILSRNGKVVFRPDSGDPVKIIVGDPEAPDGSPAWKGAVQCLWEIFGGTTTNRGFKTLDSHAGLIYGDSITLDRAQRILEGLKKKGFASDNIVFGVGSFTYQMVTRDTFGSAIKATWGIVNNEKRELWKDPKTDNGVKKSARGLLRIEKDDDGNFVLYDRQTLDQSDGGELRVVFADGKLYHKEGLEQIRKRLSNEIS